MGNISSKDKKQEPSLSNIVNKIAAKYILTANFQDLQNLKDPNYCNKIAVLTSDIIQKNLTSKEIVYLKQKTQEGKVIDKMTKADIVYLDKNKLPSLDIQTKLQKKRACYGIAKYYIKVAHLFSSIVGAVSPEFSYIDEYNIEKRVAFKDKNKIPENMKTKVKKINLCNRRINALLNNKNFDVEDENEVLTIQPRFCDINVGKKIGSPLTPSQSQINPNDPRNENNLNNTNKVSTHLYSLIDEPGIPELETLYYDVYDYDSGEYKTMSDTTKKKYLEDVKLFYKIFTGNKNVPDNVTRFSNITLKDYHTSKGCRSGDVYTQSYKGTIKDELFKKYAEHIKQMTDKASNNQKIFFKVIDQMFIFEINNETKEKDITLHPELNDEKLNELIDVTRKNLIKLYTECEKDFEEGLKIFESIVESQVKDTLKNQIEDLEKRILKSVESPSEATGSNNQKDITPIAAGLKPIEETKAPVVVNHEDVKQTQDAEQVVKEDQPKIEPVQQLIQPSQTQPLKIDVDKPQMINKYSNVPPAPRAKYNKKEMFLDKQEDFEYQNPTQQQQEVEFDEAFEESIISDFENKYNAVVTINSKNGNSFFEAINKINKIDTNSIRSKISEYIKSNSSNLNSELDLTVFKENMDDYIEYINKDGNYLTGDIEIEATAVLFNIKIEVISVDNTNTEYLSIKFNDDESLPIVYLFKLNDSNSYHNVKFLEEEDNDKSTMFNDLNKIDDLLISIPSNSTKEQSDKTTDESDEVKTSSTTSNIESNSNSQITPYTDELNKFNYINTPPNGTCFFYSIAYYLTGLDVDNNKIIDNNSNCSNALLIRKSLYYYYLTHYDTKNNDFDLLFKSQLSLDFYEDKNYLQTREKHNNKDYLDTNKIAKDWIDEIKVEDAECNTPIWANITDLHAMNLFLFEFYNITLIVYHTEYKKFYNYPYVYQKIGLSGSEVSQDELNSLYENKNVIFIAFTGNHYDVLEKKDSKYKFDKITTSFLEKELSFRLLTVNSNKEIPKDLSTKDNFDELADEIINANKQMKNDQKKIEQTYQDMEESIRKTVS